MSRSLALAFAFGALMTPAFAQAPKKRAILVGCSTYQKSGLADKPLPFAATDMENLGATLLDGGWEVQVLTSKGMANKATRKDFAEALDKTLNGINANDLVLVALSGHGQQFRANVNGADQEEAFFCPSDGVPGDAETLIGMTDLLAKLRQKGAKNLVLVDACRDDPRRGGKGVDGNTARNFPGNTANLFSCAARQQSFETNQMNKDDPQKGHGVFFWRVAKALEGEAKNDKGEITWSRLVEYVTENVNDDALRWFPERAVVSADGEKVVQTPHQVGSLVGRSPVLLQMNDESEDGKFRGARKLLLKGGPAERKQAFQSLRPLADAGHAPAAYWVGYLLTCGCDACSIDFRTAVTYLRRSADRGYAPAKTDLAYRLHNGVMGMTEDPASAASYVKNVYLPLRSLADAGDPAALEQLASLYYEGKFGPRRDLALARTYYQKAADAGHPGADWGLGYLDWNAKGAERNAAMAERWYRQVNAKGHAIAQRELAIELAYGQYFPHDLKRAFELMSRSAQQGLLAAQDGLGTMYWNGEAVKEDFDAAHKWYKSAADAGHARGQFNLGEMYQHGIGVSEDKAMAISWYRKSAAQNYSEAVEALKKLGVKP